MTRILLVTGEASGDLHGAHLAKAFQRLAPGIELVGVGGEKMAQAGVKLIPHIERVDAIGVPGLRQILAGWKTLRALSDFIRRESFDAIVLIDSPGLNLRLAKSARHYSSRIFYYIAPQVWAWGRRRVNVLRRVVRRVLAVLPFEEEFFRKSGVPCTFVGHPLLDEMKRTYDKNVEREHLGIDPDQVVIGLFPGSRQREIREILPVILKSLQSIQAPRDRVKVLLAQAPSLSDRVIQDILQASDVPVTVVKGQPSEVMAVSDCVIMASGTATLQAAIVGTPLVIVYRVSRLTYLIAKYLITINHIGLVNILAGREVAPELVQDRMVPESIAREVNKLLADPSRTRQMRQTFEDIRSSLGSPGASRRAAEIILSDIR